MRKAEVQIRPVSTKSAEICLFDKWWSKTFDTKPFCQLCIKYGLIFYKNDSVQFCNKYIVAPSQKNSFRAFKKWKMDFRRNKMKTPLGNIVWNSKMHP